MAYNPSITDPSIITQGVRESKIDLATPVNMYTSLRADRRAQKLSELTLSKEEREIKRQTDLQEIIKSNLTPNGHIDTEKIVPSLNKAGFIDEAQSILERKEKALIAKTKAEEERQREMSNAYLNVAEAKNPVEAFILAKEEGRAKGWKMSPGVLNYIPQPEEIRDGKLDPRVMQEMLYHGEKFLTPEQKIARAKRANEEESGDELYAPIYAKKDGKDVLIQAGKSGKVIMPELPEGVTLAPGVSIMDTGDKKVIVGKDGKKIAEFVIGMAPGKADELSQKKQKFDMELEKWAKEKAEGGQYKQNQYVAANFGHRMNTAFNEMESLYEKGYKREGTSQRIFDYLPNELSDEDRQQQDQAERNFINANLRRESGASIQSSEFESAEKQYFPRPGDKPAILEQKRINRLSAIGAMKAESGGAWKEVEKEIKDLIDSGKSDKTKLRKWKKVNNG